MVYRYYNFTNLTNANNQTTLLTLATEVNNQMNYVPGTLIMLAIYIILLLSLIGKGFDVFRSFAATSWVAMILAIIIYPISLISGTTLLVFIIFSANFINHIIFLGWIKVYI